MEQGENGVTGSVAGRQMARGGGTSTRQHGECVGPVMDGEDEQIRQSLSKPSWSSLSRHKPKRPCKSCCGQGWGAPCTALAEGLG